jgi:septum formation protein
MGLIRVMGNRRIILASSSVYRRELLSRLGLAFQTHSPDIDEAPLAGETPRQLVERLSREKACKVAEQFSDALVIGSDQVADHDGRIVGKPVDHEDAVAQLMHASGRRIVLFTGLALVNTATGRIQSEVEPFEVTFRRFGRETVERYLRFEKPYNCSGSLRAEGAGICLLQSLRGDDPNALIGLPLIKLCDMLHSEGVTLFPEDSDQARG